jgi:preprotein translocase subunit Sec61beta
MRGGWSLVVVAAVAMTAVVWLARGQRDAIVYAGLAVAVMAVQAAKDRWSR